MNDIYILTHRSIKNVLVLVPMILYSMALDWLVDTDKFEVVEEERGHASLLYKSVSPSAGETVLLRAYDARTIRDAETAITYAQHIMVVTLHTVTVSKSTWILNFENSHEIPTDETISPLRTFQSIPDVPFNSFSDTEATLLDLLRKKKCVGIVYLDSS